MPETPPWSAEDILSSTGATLFCGQPNTFFPDIGTDSRKASGPALFVALRGEVHDGHDFIAKALQAGYAGILMEKARWPEMRNYLKSRDCPVFGVENTFKALGQLARHRLKRFQTQVVAVTGSNGKTSTKEMLGSIFRKTGPCLVTQGNFNNEVGLPLTLFRLKPADKWAILELGMNHPGEMARLSSICQPDFALITRIAPAHLEGLGSIEGVARAKGEIFSAMAQGKTALVNGQDPNSTLIPLREGLRVLRFGLEPSCDFYMKNPGSDATGSCFDLCRPGYPPLPIRIGIPGAMMAENALAAAATALSAGISEEVVQEGLMDFRGFPGRFQPMQAQGGFTLINDTYNANPDSMKAALQELARLGTSGRRFAVLGSMGELGDNAAALHRQVGALAAAAGLTALYCCGPHGQDLAQGARKAGLDHVVQGEKEALASMLRPGLQAGDWVLVKGSRSMTMESLVAQLMQDIPPSSRN
ncbi:UDP-N-acetylmuramoyl-tripeptide--D-alanyl-D-alanine ligase [Desulfobotulus sp.]|jgi:UDP-N-acetylmuramoyl-tripeptide--D-alanyl-D-alanine ligase|uniref:UDP-N-acetylmuramoyl-tripeptide--D-alanyl-D- alanine ligase n=1 Tax=Desulfobotulus sp. TaxID=1940337 RepID=UPI002A367098|nr:UDP-N-acetylmuramoyl-tripeptide--D-alanyl-D-alanine ligase [Desulfobotulus sp.]MDY0164012.1 UDP-N-acetylmuramoyl-tripeptide--D-alanyl-D-alanine ligase [Desulfobotulus sp.]